MTRKREPKTKGDEEVEAFAPPSGPPAKAGGKISVALTMAELEDPQQRFAAWSSANMTGFEKKVWNFLGKEDNPWHFRSQQVVGPYILDFLAVEKFLCIEADGPTHRKSVEADAKRDAWLRKKHSILVLRLTPSDFVRHTPQKLYALIEEMASPKHALVSKKRGKNDKA